jgi:hypothetical protein
MKNYLLWMIGIVSAEANKANKRLETVKDQHNGE